jgi:molybdopterin converting factor small subunit
MVMVRYWGGARDIAGRSDEIVAGGPLASVLDGVRAAHGPRMERLLAVSVLLLDGERIDRDEALDLADDAVLEVLPPSSGG